MPDIDELTFYTQARVLVRATGAELLATAKTRAPDPSIFETYPPFIWLNEISSDRLDAYYTEMDPETTLPNYARDAAEGVAVLVGHNTRELPIGYSLTGSLEHVDGVTRVLSDAYALQDETTAAVINRLRAGIVRDDSVGFSARGAMCVCSICGRDMWRDWDCWHIPGFEYEVTEEGSKGSQGAKVMRLATGLIVNAHLSEYSLVYDGATPGAAVLQAQRCATAGRIAPHQAQLIEQRYRIRLPDRQRMAAGATLRGEPPMPPEKDQEERTELVRVTGEEDVHGYLARIRAILERAKAPSDLLVEAGVQWLADRVQALEPEAADGRAYRQDLLVEAEEQAVRAFGAEAAEGHRAMLATSPIATIKQFTSAWRAIGDAALPTGRATEETSSEPAAPALELPSALYG
jgi:hypothetical protein